MISVIINQLDQPARFSFALQINKKVSLQLASVQAHAYHSPQLCHSIAPCN